MDNSRYSAVFQAKIDMTILGIADGQTSGAAIMEDDRILAAVNEERISRIKMARGFPWQSIEEVFRLSSTRPQDLDGVAVATINMELREKVTDWPGWLEAREEEKDIHLLSSSLRAAARQPRLKLAGARLVPRQFLRARLTPAVCARFPRTIPRKSSCPTN
ncbi:MAG: hypothetical protein A2Z18_02410 [Armatimonadetes bacterium RBG_16_58_9]|nr:MAG: hypothetical protein A2Z18_02410 [Armatimonadetes bacterium RBG_16_58_9]